MKSKEMKGSAQKCEATKETQGNTGECEKKRENAMECKEI